jgi:hypothetical protein
VPLRSFVRDRASLGAALVLAGGLGAASAIFTLVNALILAPLPFSDPDRLVAARIGGRSWSPFMLEAVGREATTLRDLAGVQGRTATVTGEHRPLQVQLESVSASYFALLGARPACTAVDVRSLWSTPIGRSRMRRTRRGMSLLTPPLRGCVFSGGRASSRSSMPAWHSGTFHGPAPAFGWLAAWWQPERRS